MTQEVLKEKPWETNFPQKNVIALEVDSCWSHTTYPRNKQTIKQFQPKPPLTIYCTSLFHNLSLSSHPKSPTNPKLHPWDSWPEPLKIIPSGVPDQIAPPQSTDPVGLEYHLSRRNVEKSLRKVSPLITHPSSTRPPWGSRQPGAAAKSATWLSPAKIWNHASHTTTGKTCLSNQGLDWVNSLFYSHDFFFRESRFGKFCVQHRLW